MKRCNAMTAMIGSDDLGPMGLPMPPRVAADGFPI